jgi:hypothetical protein
MIGFSVEVQELRACLRCEKVCGRRYGMSKTTAEWKKQEEVEQRLSEKINLEWLTT